ncbi:thiamine ABC transporter ATP-binding protein [Neogemmobacter tilapiae]|uniref:Thiamine import ATP-binding protein ThiQ n=1 Tax=Neogemmobacter tilapiae TaxID=875041 RepID=A0A918TQ71_9RHOB|nr:ATP-binding cassette domain-containing protein [Gemmobacter tilapiae]GHC56044.1 thiamine import ATP-binding protein ThiQ [Gemmobacter tilapiae]
MLRFEDVVLQQGDFTLRADWPVASGAKLAVIGPSGSGKSTLLLAVAGFLPPMQGRILWQGQDLAVLPPGARPVTMLFQDQNLFPHLTVAQNIGLGLSPRLRLTTQDHDSIARALDRVGLPEMAQRRPGALSGGQMARVALARALLRARPILLLDEPFSALGPALKDEMLDLVTGVAQDTGALVMMVSHDPGDAQRFADQTVLVADGIACTPTPTSDLFANPPPALRTYLGS